MSGCFFLKHGVGSVVHRMNEATLYSAQLALEWVTIFGQVNHLDM